MKSKPFFIVSAVAVSMLFTIISCKDKTRSGNVSNSPELEAHLITQEQAKILATEYENNNYKIINAQRKTPDSKEIYYDIDVLEEYIQYVKAEAKSKGIANVGITIAFGQYPNNGDFDKRLNPNYLGYQTVFLKPTIKQIIKSPNDSLKHLCDPDGIKTFDFGQLSPPN